MKEFIFKRPAIKKQNKETILKITNAIYHLPYGDVRN